MKIKRILAVMTRLVSLLLILGGGMAQVTGLKAVDVDMTKVGVGNYYRVIGGMNGEPFFPPALPLVILWIATYLRDPSVFR